MPDYGENPTREGNAEHAYEFDKWSPSVAEATEDVTYTAQYKESTNVYTVTWKDSDGTTLEKDENVPFGATPSYDGAEPSKASTAQYTYEFSGWTPEVETVSGDMTYTATYKGTVRTYTIKFVDENGTVLQTVEVKYGDVPEYTKDEPSKADKVEEKKEKHTETVTEKVEQPKLDENGDPVVDENGDPVMEEVEVEKEVEVENVVETNTTSYNFAGWKKNGSDDTGVVAVTGDATYTATYDDSSASKYLVRFIDDNGKVISKKEYAAGTRAADITKPADPVKAATAEYTYTFSGWTPEISDVDGSATYTATYKAEKNSYNITFKDEDGTTLATIKVPYGEVPAYKGETPSKSGTDEYAYSFSGWSPALKEVTGDAEYTAQYSRATNKYTVRWNNYDGSNLETDEDVLYGSTPEYNGKTPVHPEDDTYTYKFSGWTPDVSTVTGNATYTATFDEVRKPSSGTDEKQEEPDDTGDTADTDDDGNTDTPAATTDGGGRRGGTTAPAAPAAAVPAQAQPAQDRIAAADNDNAEAEDIPENSTPLAASADGEGEGEGAWALINLLTTALASIGSAAAIIRGRRKDEEDDDGDDPDDDNDGRKHNRLSTIAPAAASVLAFILTENMSNPMQLADKWTPLMALLLGAEALTMYLTRSKTGSEEDEED